MIKQPNVFGAAIWTGALALLACAVFMRWPRSAAQAAAWGNSTAMRFGALVSTIATRI